MRTRLAAVAALSLVALAGCSTPAPVVTPTAAAPAISPSVTPEPEVAVPSELVVRGAGVELYDTDGTLVGSFVWADETEAALEVLELAFGPAPAPGLNLGDGTHYADYETYDFDGLLYFSAIDLGKPRNEYFLPATVQIDAAEIDGVSIRTVDGISVGGPGADVRALSPALDYPHAEGVAYLLDPVDPSRVSDPEDATDMVAAVVGAADRVVRLMAPYPSRSFV